MAELVYRERKVEQTVYPCLPTVPSVRWLDGCIKPLAGVVTNSASQYLLLSKILVMASFAQWHRIDHIPYTKEHTVVQSTYLIGLDKCCE